jgi:hypothetical protein
VLSKRRVWATIARTPLVDTAFAMHRAAARLVASGFSTSRGLPARHVASTIAGWSIGGTAHDHGLHARVSHEITVVIVESEPYVAASFVPSVRLRWQTATRAASGRSSTMWRA